MLKILMVVAASKELAANALEQAKHELNLSDSISMVFENCDAFFSHCHEHLGGGPGLTILENIELANKYTGDGIFVIFHNPYLTGTPTSYPFELQSVIRTIVAVNDDGHLSYHHATAIDDGTTDIPATFTEDNLREITTHLSPNAHCPVKIFAGDTPGQAGGNNLYYVTGFDLRTNAVMYDVSKVVFRGPAQAIAFQNGFPVDGVFNGITLETLFAIAADRLQGFQSGPYACKENAAALEHALMAIDCLQERTKVRVDLGVHESTVNHETMQDTVDDIIDFDTTDKPISYKYLDTSDFGDMSEETVKEIILTTVDQVRNALGKPDLTLDEVMGAVNLAYVKVAEKEFSDLDISTYNLMLDDIRGARNKSNHVGQNFEEFLEEHGTLEELNAGAKARVEEWQATQPTKV